MDTFCIKKKSDGLGKKHLNICQECPGAAWPAVPSRLNFHTSQKQSNKKKKPTETSSRQKIGGECNVINRNLAEDKIFKMQQLKSKNVSLYDTFPYFMYFIHVFQYTSWCPMRSAFQIVTNVKQSPLRFQSDRYPHHLPREEYIHSDCSHGWWDMFS